MTFTNRRVFNGSSPWIHKLDPRPIHVGFMVDKLALGQVSQYFGFPLSVIFQLSPTLYNLRNQERL